MTFEECELCGKGAIFEIKNGLCEMCCVIDNNNTMILEKMGAGVGGQWIDKSTVTTGDLIKIKSEAVWVEGNEGRPKQLVAKMRIKGTSEDVNVSINNPSRQALMSAFGDDTALWEGKVVVAAVEKGIFAGKRGTMLNLVPDGYVVAEDSAGFILIRPKVEAPAVVAANPTKHVRSKVEVEEGIDISVDNFDL